MNCHRNQLLIADAANIYHQLVRNYRHYSYQLEYAFKGAEFYERCQYQVEPKLGPWINSFLMPIQYVNHVIEILKSATAALTSSYLASQIRNELHPLPEKCSLVEDSLKAYWEIVEFLSVSNKQVCLYVLAAVLTEEYLKDDAPDRLSIKTNYKLHQIGNLAEKSTTRLIQEFLVYSKENFDASIKFLKYMIIHSETSRYERFRNRYKPIDYVLNTIYPVIAEKNPELALKTVRDAMNVERPFGHGATVVWKPDDCK